MLGQDIIRVSHLNSENGVIASYEAASLPPFCKPFEISVICGGALFGRLWHILPLSNELECRSILIRRYNIQAS